MGTVEHQEKLSVTAEFAQRAAYAWVRAADAGVIGAAELSWLLAHLPPGSNTPGQRGGAGVGPSRGAHAAGPESPPRNL